jgi:subtilisin-like proprotein convertase family protein
MMLMVSVAEELLPRVQRRSSQMMRNLGTWHVRWRRLVLAGFAAMLATLALAAPSWAGVVRTNNAAITINDNAAASVYPSTINVSGLPSRGITDLNVSLNGISHTYPDDLDILLVGPSGQKVMLMSDAGGDPNLSNVNLIFDDDPVPPPDSGAIWCCRISPSNYNDGPENMPSPAPAEPYGTSLSVFDGTDPNGPWNLLVRDDNGGDTGQMAGGWSLDISVSSPHNDRFSNAQSINTSAATINGDNVASSFETGEPNQLGGGTVWYRWTAPNSGQTNIDTCDTDYDPIMGVFTGSAVNSLTPPAPALGFINNGCLSGFGDKTTFTAQAGTTYNIQVGGWPGGAPQRTFTLNLSGPANTKPTITPVSPLRPTRDRTPLIRATVTDTAGLTSSNIRLLVDNKARSFSYDPATGALSYTSGRLSSGKHMVKIVATDAHGGVTTKSWRFTIR